MSLNEAPSGYLFHEPGPGLIDTVKFLVLLVALLLDLLGRSKDVLEVEPVTLAEFPLLNSVSNSD